MPLPESDSERRGEDALRIAEAERARRRREGHSMAGQGPNEASPNMRGSGSGVSPNMLPETSRGDGDEE